MICFPNGKINLGLRVLAKRADGFHDIESLLFPVPINDALEFLPADAFQLTISGFPISGATTDNLVFKAWKLLCQQYDIPAVKVCLHKAIPLQSGLGGGSADAAFFIRAANVFFSLGMDESKMREMAVQLGSDCPFFIENKPVLARGKGDVLQAVNISLKGKYLLVCQPKALVSSREAYTLIKPGISKTGIKEVVAKPIEQWRDLLKNDFEDVLFDLHPEIREIKNSMHKMGAIYSSMTGSGSAVYGIFDQSPDRKEINPNYYLWHGEI
ncbi:MAG: 4-(cytidine 5'-diphospho)-2-C-methyl-D-erythritol kinase [Bacteroidales bacterium]|nr:4-(cytidine 5'-diphospho)-2-C-methyl-D-erythritol kinase [Bacteroidales bacterium]